MKVTIFSRLSSLVAGLACPLAGLVTLTTPRPALASDWGCQVVLCLATPRSPTTYPECVPPITRLWQALALGSPFPTCAGVGVRTRETRQGFDLTVMQSDGVVSSYRLDTRHQTVTPQ